MTFSINVPVAILLVASGTQILHVWIGPQINPSLLLLLGMGMFVCLTSIGGPLAALLNGANVITFQVVCAVLMGLAKLAISIVLIHWLGLPGIILGTVIAAIVFIYIPSAFYLPRWFSSFETSCLPDSGKPSDLRFIHVK